MERNDNILTIEELEQKVVEWQKRLRLQDWHIKTAIVRQNSDEYMENKCAVVNWTLANKQATIKLIDPIDYPETTRFEYDMEKVLVHEMLHLHISPLTETETEEAQYILMEQAVESLATSVVDLLNNK